MYCQLWWTDGGSNPGPPECKSGALPAELPAQTMYYQKHQTRQRYQKSPTSVLIKVLMKWCPKRESNSQPTDYKSVALPIELFGPTIIVHYKPY